MAPPRALEDLAVDPGRQFIQDVRRATRRMRQDWARAGGLDMAEVEERLQGPPGWRENAMMTLAAMGYPGGLAPGAMRGGSVKGGADAKGGGWQGMSAVIPSKFGTDRAFISDDVTAGTIGVGSGGGWQGMSAVIPSKHGANSGFLSDDVTAGAIDFGASEGSWEDPFADLDIDVGNSIVGGCLPIALFVNHPPYVNVVPGSDFTPPIGPAVGAMRAPGTDRLMIALSEDGLEWSRTNLVITDQAAVPTAIQVDGVVYLFYCPARLDGFNGAQVVMACSTDLINWLFKYLDFRWDLLYDNIGVVDPIDWKQQPFDPTVVADEDNPGRFRMYFSLKGEPSVAEDTEGDPTHFATFSAVCDDLMSCLWRVEGNRRYPVDPDVKAVQDPSVQWVGDHYQYFAGAADPGDDGAGRVYHAVSMDSLSMEAGVDFFPSPTDGGYASEDDLLVYTSKGPFGMPLVITERVSFLPANGVEIDGEYKYYGFQQVGAEYPPAARILSRTWVATESSSTTVPKGAGGSRGSRGSWVLDEGVRLELDESRGLESSFVMDPAVCAAPTKQGQSPTCFVMIYDTRIPGAG